MWNYKETPARILVLVLLFCANVTMAQSPDETSLVRSAVTNFFSAYQRKDADGLMALWSSKSPQRESFAADARKTFSGTDGTALKSFEIRRLNIEGTSATVILQVELNATKPGTITHLNRVLRLVKEDGPWKVWQYESRERELVTKLLAAKTESDQKALLEAEPDLVTAELVLVLKIVSDTFSQRRELSQTIVGLKLMRSIAERIGDEKSAAYAIVNLGVTHYNRAEYQQASQLFEHFLSWDPSKRDPSLTARALNTAGMIKRIFGDNVGALDYVQRSRQIAEQAGDKQMLGAAFNNLGVIYRDHGEYARALDYFEKGLVLAEAVGNKTLISLTLNNIGTVHGTQGNQLQAIAYFQRALKLAQAADDKSLMAYALNNIGLTHHRYREYPQALNFYQQSLALREQLKDERGAALTLNNIGLLNREQGDHKRALEYYQRSLAIREKLDDQSGMAYVLNHIGYLNYLEGEYQQALDISKRTIEISTRLHSPETLWRGLELAGRAHTSLKQFDEAEKDLIRSIETIEQLRHRVGGDELARQRFFEDKVLPYWAMVELAFSRNRPVDALTYGELAKARTLLDVLRNGRIPINKAMSTEEQEMERTANAELTTLNAKLYDEKQRPKPNLERIAELEPQREKARLAYESFLTSLYVKYPELKVQRGEAMPLTAAEAAALIPDRSTAIVEFVVADDKSYVLVLSSDRTKTASPLNITMYPIKIRANQLSERVDAFRRMLAERDLNYQDAARQLYDLLLKPAEEQLRGKKTLCIVPDRVLWELPFQALQPKTGVHLIENYTLFYAPSLSVLREVTKPSVATRSGSLLAFGNPQLDGDPARTRGDAETRFGPLPEAETEVKTLAQLYGAGKSRIFIGAEAREKVVKTEAPKYQVLHFATHGLLDNRNPMFSFLTLAQTTQDPNEDGLLEAREIINMDLHAKLAVLSACQTARGWVGAGEGVIGMSWALFVAGVPTTVASQWKVDSASTTSLMIDFHRRLTKSKLTKAEALRQAELGLLRSERYRHPFYWAGFVMIGD
ncbi:MAG TPA: CHAT domain-containing protein, partial [Pyrinomonadaceae bacterium]|nr:CHAT domain-containing protein [Pyrinomonadaceae bacterium]